MSKRIDIRIPEDTLERIDREARERKMTRTAVLIERWNESRAVEPTALDAPVLVGEDLSPRPQAEAMVSGESPGPGPSDPHETADCLHPKAKVLKLRTCPDCGGRV